VIWSRIGFTRGYPKLGATVHDLSVRYKVGVSTIFSWIYTRKLRALRAGSAVVIPHSEHKPFETLVKGLKARGKGSKVRRVQTVNTTSQIESRVASHA
jgi:hypothetical protein